MTGYVTMFIIVYTTFAVVSAECLEKALVAYASYTFVEYLTKERMNVAANRLTQDY